MREEIWKQMGSWIDQRTIDQAARLVRVFRGRIAITRAESQQLEITGRERSSKKLV